MELYLTDQHRLLRDSVREFARIHVAPGADERDRSGAFPTELVAALGRQRWMGIPFPAEFGGLGADTLAFVLTAEELAAVDSGLAATVSAHTWMGTLPIHLFGSPDQRSAWLPWLCTGRRLAAFAANPGTRPTRTTASLADGVWTLNGTEHSVVSIGTPLTACLSATVATGPGEGRPELSTVLVPGDSPGYSVGPPIRRIGWRSGDARPVAFDDCLVAEAGLLGPRGDGLEQFLRVIDANRIGLAAIGVGIAQAALDQASAELRRRRSLPEALPVAALEAQVVDLSTGVEAVRLLTWRAALERDHGRPFALTAAQARLAAGGLALAATEAALEASGGFGELEEGGAWRLFRDARMLAICDGSQEAQRAAVASELGFGAPGAAPAAVPVARLAPAPAVPPIPAVEAPSPPPPPEETAAPSRDDPTPLPEAVEPIGSRLAATFATETGLALSGLALGIVICLILLASWRV